MQRSGAFEIVYRFLVGGGFPAFALSLLVFYELLLLGLLVAPGAESGLGAFADDFRVWCFGYDPATGRLDWGFVFGMVAPPSLMGAILCGLWWTPLRELAARPGALLRHAVAALLVVASLGGGLALLGSPAPRGELPFPGRQLRTAHPPPALALVDQEGQPVALEALRGQVVLLTAVYASCPHTCPLILAQTKRALAALEPEELADVRVVAVTLDPAHDSPDVLAELARLQGMPAPRYRLVTGAVAEVERVLDEMGVARRRDPETGVIDHANLFLLLDRQGRVAYRLTLGERQERWLVSALRLLLRERADVG